MIRVNLDEQAHRAGYPVPMWAEKLITEIVNIVSVDYQINPNDSSRYFFPIPGQADVLASELRDRLGLDVSSYKIPNIPSWGLIFKEDDPIVVEYKLKYGKGSLEED